MSWKKTHRHRWSIIAIKWVGWCKVEWRVISTHKTKVAAFARCKAGQGVVVSAAIGNMPSMRA